MFDLFHQKLVKIFELGSFGNIDFLEIRDFFYLRILGI